MIVMGDRFNIPGVRASGIKKPFKKQKIEGSKACECGQTISANKLSCARCAGDRAERSIN
jgi:hypothetical protein